MNDFLVPEGSRVRVEQEDGISSVTVLSRDGGVLWKKGPPIEAAWREVWPVHDILERVQRGSYQYVNGVRDNQIFVVFTPFGGLDFNVIFDFNTGEILRLSEAR